MKRTQETTYPVVARSHPGSTGKNNEDRFAVSAYRSDAVPHAPILVAIISDGIGGHRGGEIASEMTVNLITQYLANSEPITPLKTLQEAIQSTSNLVFEQAESKNGTRGMGSTVAATWIIGKRLYTSHVGDSRIFLLRNHQLHQLSVDHSWVQEAMEMGIITEVEAKKHPNAHVIRRYLGSPTPPAVDQRLYLHTPESDESAMANQGLELKPGDRIFLTTDGVTDLISNEDLLGLWDGQNLEQVVTQTIDTANERGGFDNLSIVAIEIPLSLSLKGWFEINWPKIVLGMIIILLVLLIASLLWLSRISFLRELFT
jgi:serine/threonine protein phosphatase PrpC